MTLLIGILVFAILVIVLIQISRITEVTRSLRGDEDWKWANSKRTANLLLAFGIIFLILCTWSSLHYKNYMMGYGPHISASEHGNSIDSLWHLTMWLTGIVFFITQFLLFYFAWKYREKKGRRASFIHDNERLEMIWTIIPTIVFVFLTVKGMVLWNDILADVKDDEEILEVEAMGMQFNWIFRYPGEDGKLGTRDFRATTGNNPLGQIWTDPKNLDDLQPSDMVLPKGQKVRVRILARDVLHSFFLPHFRVKMDAVPGMPTYFVFTPTQTTEEYRAELSKYPEYQVPSDPNDPDGPKKWETFEFELACAELCGSGHFAMRKVVRVVEPDEYDAWLSEQTPYYLSSVRGKNSDPYKDQLFDFEIADRKKQFENDMYEEMYKDLDEGEERIFKLSNVHFETGTDVLSDMSKYELNNLVDFLNDNPDLRIEIAGHTDNTGDEDANVALSESRAQRAYDFLVEKGVNEEQLKTKGYGSAEPVDTNETSDGRANNRRIEIKFL